MSNWFTPDRFNYDYVQSTAPSGAEEGEMWYETDTDTASVYDGASWVELSVTDHSQLSGVTASAHHARPTPGAGLAEDANGNFDVQTTKVQNDALPFAEGFAPGFTG